MELAVRTIPEAFTTSNGKTWMKRQIRDLEDWPRDDIKSIAKFLHGYWNAEEINRTWLGQAATKGQMIEFIETGYIRTAITEREKHVAGVSVPEVPDEVDEEASYTHTRNGQRTEEEHEDDLATQIARAVQNKIKTGSASKEQIDALKAYVDSQDADLAESVKGLIDARAEDIGKLIGETENLLRSEFSELLATARPQQQTIRIEVGSDRSYTIDGRRHECFDDLFLDIVAMMETGNTHKANFWLCGPAGTGKTTAARMIAEKLGLPFYFNGAIDSEYKLRGFIDAQGRIIYTPFRRAFQYGGVYLFDECDASMPSACLAFNAALANGSYDFPTEEDNQLPIDRHNTCIILAGANTWNGPEGGFVGRMRQDGAFLDRFARIPWTVDENLERALCTNMEWVDYCQAVRRRIISAGVEHIVSPRCTMGGDALLRAGRPWKRAVETWVRKGLDEADWQKIGGGY